MVFSSPIFFFLFLPLTLLAYFASPARLRNLVLLLASVAFYAWGELRYLLLLLASIGLNFAGGLWIAGREGRARKAALATVVAVNLAGLGWFKYAAFFAANLNSGFAALGVSEALTVPQIVLPLGISFFTFHAISYLVDVYRGKVSPQRNPIDYALYILFFPQLIAGPIIRYHDIAAQLSCRSTILDDAAEGIRRIAIGLVKKLLIANTLAQVADPIFATPAGDLSTAAIWLGAVCYMGQIYFDFSAYSDMAIGLCRLFGFRILENFNYPYAAQSIQDFWRRWHISLSNWFREYVYIPLGGNRNGGLATARNLLIVFLLCGLWHGASWTFVIWGLYHGLFLALERTRWGALLASLPRPLRHAYALLVVLVGWVFFRADSLPQALAWIGRMFMPAGGRAAAEYIDIFGWLVLLLAIPAAVPQRASRWLLGSGGQPIGWWQSGAVAGLGMLGFVLLFAATYNPFIYFRF